MALEIEGTLINKLAVQSGTSSRGPWARQDILVEYQDGQYSEKALMTVFGVDRVKDLEQYQIGDKVKVSFKLQSREYNGRWFGDIRVWKITRSDAAAPAPVDDYTSSRAPYSPSVQTLGAENMPQDIGASTGFGIHEGQETADTPQEDDLPF